MKRTSKVNTLINMWIQSALIVAQLVEHLHGEQEVLG